MVHRLLYMPQRGLPQVLCTVLVKFVPQRVPDPEPIICIIHLAPKVPCMESCFEMGLLYQAQNKEKTAGKAQCKAPMRASETLRKALSLHVEYTSIYLSIYI